MAKARLIVEIEDENGRVGRKFMGTEALRLDETIQNFLDLVFYNSIDFVTDAVSEDGLKTLEYDNPPGKKAAPRGKQTAGKKKTAAASK
jgi:hypothetical protein